MLRIPVTIMFVAIDTGAVVLEIVRLTKLVVKLPPRFWGTVPLKFTVPEVLVSAVALELLIKSPLAVSVCAPSATIPEVIVKAPLTVGPAERVRVFDAGEKATVRLLKFVAPVMVLPATPLNETVPLPGTNPASPTPLDQEAPFISILYVDAFSVDVGVQPPGMDSVPFTVIFRLSVTFIPWTLRLVRTVVLTGISGPIVIFGDEGVLKYTTLEVVPNTGVPEKLPVP
jgi:hypothetical protein